MTENNVALPAEGGNHSTERPSTVEIFQAAKDVVANFLRNQTSENNNLPDMWDMTLENAMTKINSSAPVNQGSTFDYQEWSSVVRNALSDQMESSNQYNVSHDESVSGFPPSDPESIDKLHRTGSEVIQVYTYKQSALIDQLSDTWNSLSRPDYVNQFADGTIDRARLIALTNAIEQFKMSQLWNENTEGWAGKLFGKISEMMGNIEQAIEARNLLVAGQN